MRDDKVSNAKMVENLQKKVEPVLLKMITDAPFWGSVNLKMIFNSGQMKRIEVTTNESIQVLGEN